MRKIFIVAFLTFCTINSFCQTLTLEEFKKEAELSGLHFEMPIGYTIKAVKENGDLQYSFAIINSERTMEVRYSLFPMKEMLAEYEKSKKTPNAVMINPNKLHNAIMSANGLNMTSGKDVNIGDFPPQAVKEEFNADYGGSSFFEFNCEFGKGYKYGQCVCLHKENVADVLITFMSNDKGTHSDLMEIPFHSLTFK